MVMGSLESIPWNSWYKALDTLDIAQSYILNLTHTLTILKMPTSCLWTGGENYLGKKLQNTGRSPKYLRCKATKPSN